METYTMQRETETGYQDDPCSCVIGSFTGERIDDDDCPIHGYSASESDRQEARENMREFAAGLPLFDDCAFSFEYDHPISWIPARVANVVCDFGREGRMFEGNGSSLAAAYGRMIAAIIEREA